MKTNHNGNPFETAIDAHKAKELQAMGNYQEMLKAWRFVTSVRSLDHEIFGDLHSKPVRGIVWKEVKNGNADFFRDVAKILDGYGEQKAWLVRMHIPKSDGSRRLYTVRELLEAAKKKGIIISRERLYPLLKELGYEYLSRKKARKNSNRRSTVVSTPTVFALNERSMPASR